MKHSVLALCLCIVCGFFMGVNAAPDPNFHIYLCFGQSNMEGQGNIESQDRTCDSRFQKLVTVDNSSCMGTSKGKWTTATPPIVSCDGKLSPLDYFGRELIENLPSEIKVGVVAVAVAGCDIQLFEKNNYKSYASTAQSWMSSRINNYGGNPYGRLIEMAKEAQKSGVIKGILLHQGESNSGQNNWPSRVKAIYNDIIADLGLNADEVPLLAGEVHPSGSCSSMNRIIANLPSQRSNFYVVSASGITGMLNDGQNVHFNSAGYRELGKRYAQKMLEVLKFDPVPPTPVTPDYYFNGEELRIETEEMPTVDGQYCKPYNENFAGMAYYANNDLTSATVNFKEKGDYYFTLRGCADASTKASVTFSVGDQSTTFSWDNSVAQNISKVLSVPDTGTYKVQILMETDNGQSDAFVDYLIISKIEPTSFNLIHSSTLGIYPNPAEDFLYVTGENIERVIVSSLNGVEMLQTTESVIDVRSILTGSYMVRVTTKDGNVKVFPLMKK